MITISALQTIADDLRKVAKSLGWKEGGALPIDPTMQIVSTEEHRVQFGEYVHIKLYYCCIDSLNSEAQVRGIFNKNGIRIPAPLEED